MKEIMKEKTMSEKKGSYETKKSKRIESNVNKKKRGISKQKKMLKRTRGPVIVKYNSELSKKKKRKFGMLKKIREFSIITGKSVMTIIQGSNDKYDVYLTHEDLLYDFGFDKISKIVVGNPKIYESWNNVLRTKGKKSSREFYPKSVINEKNPNVSDERYLNTKRRDFLKREINDKIFK